MKAQIKAIIASAVVVVLCLSAIGGVTYSWFSDTESNNITINTAYIDIKITSIEKGTVTGYGDAEINQTARSITINNLAANCTIPLTFTLSNDSSIDIVYVLKTTINNYSALDNDTKQHVKINGNTLNSSVITEAGTSSVITEVGSIIDDETTEFVIPVTISSDSSYGDSTDVQLPRTIQMTFDVIAYQADYPTNTLVSGEAKISSNKIVQGEAYPSDTDAKEIETIVDFSSVSSVTGTTTSGTSINEDVSNLSIKVESKSDNNGFDTGVGTIGLTLFNGSDRVEGAEFGSEEVTVTATIKDVMTNPGIVQVLYKADDGTIERIKTTSYVYDSTIKTLTVTFKTTHFSNFTVVPVVAFIDGKQYSTLSEAMREYSADDYSRGIPIELIGAQFIIPTEEALKGKDYIFSGTSDTIIFIPDSGSYEHCFYALDGSTVTFNDLTIKTDCHYQAGFARMSGTYNNCVIDGTYYLQAGTHTFNNCTFRVVGDAYNLWTWGAKTVTIDQSKFYCDGKSVNLYGGAGENKVTTLSISNSTFNDRSNGTNYNKAAVETGNDYNASYILNLSNNVIYGFQINEEGSNTGTKEWANKKSMTEDHLLVTIDGKIVYGQLDQYEAILNKTAYKTLAEAIGVAKDKSTITLLKDVTISSEDLSIDSKNITLDLYGNVITVRSGSTTFSNDGEKMITINIIDGTIITPTKGTYSGIVVESNTTLNLTNVTINASAGSGILPIGEGATVNLYNSHVIASVWGISTNANTSPDEVDKEGPTTYGVTINIQNSTIETKSTDKDNTAVMLNVGSSKGIGGKLTINNSTLISDRICLIVRAGDATVTNTKFIYGGGFTYYDPNKYSGVSSDFHWESGNEVTTGVIVVGNLTKTAYKADAKLTITDSEVQSDPEYKTLVIAQDSINKKTATVIINGSPTVLTNAYTNNGLTFTKVTDSTIIIPSPSVESE